ncbi:MAG: ribonucleotide-diphosphate reductase subunit beta [Myxococcales bacterium]|nr:ribonucleotide-diphosphate reductase subunit beta [Polyangiaceae bacterium]MDW8249650.1 ribonucleotide-diphosphate reductase subunit beta [Myxococcales bacterium]
MGSTPWARTGTNWVFRDESAHITFALLAAQIIRDEEQELFDRSMRNAVCCILDEAIGCEHQFAEDLLGLGVAGFSARDIRTYLEFIADQRLTV